MTIPLYATSLCDLFLGDKKYLCVAISEKGVTTTMARRKTRSNSPWSSEEDLVQRVYPWQFVFVFIAEEKIIKERIEILYEHRPVGMNQ